MMWLLFSPIGRYIAIAVAGITLIAGVYMKVKSDARSEFRNEITQDALKRVENAVRSGDNVNADPERLRDPDRACRDCR